MDFYNYVGECGWCDCFLVAVKVSDPKIPFDYEAAQCPKCDRVFTDTEVVDVTGCEVTVKELFLAV